MNTELFQENTTDDIISDGVNLSFFDVVYIYRLHTTVGQHSRSPTVANEFQIGLYDLAEADLELFCNCWSAEILGEQLYERIVTVWGVNIFVLQLWLQSPRRDLSRRVFQ